MGDLYLYDHEFKASDQQILAKGIFGITDKPVPISDWKSLATTIIKQSKINHLVLDFHSYGGGMLVGGEAKDLGEKSVKALFLKVGSRPPKIEKISFFGCNIANRPTQMVTFGEIFGAETVSGYTWSIVKHSFNFKFPKGTDELEIKKVLEPFADYTAEELPAAINLAKVVSSRPQEVKIVACYGSQDGNEASKVPIPSGEMKMYQPLKYARKIKITAKSAESAERVYQSDPATRFELVTITLRATGQNPSGGR